MQSGHIHTAQLVFLALLLIVVFFAMLARKLQTPYPIVLVFVLIGLQLPRVLEGIRDYKIGPLLLYGVLFSAMVIVLRLLWTFAGARLAHLVQTRILSQSGPRPLAKQVFVAGWTGMRGVVSLAAAIALPEALSDGRAFPHRDLTF